METERSPRERGERKEAVKTYTILSRQYTKSAHLAAAYVGIGEYYARVYRAYKRGQRARLMLSVPFEDHWERPVTELRAELIDEN